MTIATIVGTRPQFIKLVPFSRIIRKEYNEIIIHTGQHYDNNMSKHFFKEMDIPDPDFSLNIADDSPIDQTGRMMLGIEEVLDKISPDLIVVFGDTNTTLAGALVGSKRGIPVLHIESGLRSNNRTMPEEINRIVTDHVSDMLMAPTPKAMDNLQKEGLKERAFLTGDIMVDTLNMFIETAQKSSDIIKRIGLQPGEYYLLTLHRPYNVDDKKKLQEMLTKLNALGDKIVFPVHPRTARIKEELNNLNVTNIEFIEPVGYLDILVLENNAKKIITDSGGMQKEAYILKIPCITLRPETEWEETIAAGWNLLLHPDNPDYNIIKNFMPSAEQKFSFGINVAEKIVQLIKEKYN